MRAKSGALAIGALLATGFFVYSWPVAWISTILALLAHIALGLALLLHLGLKWPRRSRIGWGLVALSAAPAGAILVAGAGGVLAVLVPLHAGLAIAGVAILAADLAVVRGGRPGTRLVMAAGVAVALAAAAIYLREGQWRSAHKIANDGIAPAAMGDLATDPSRPNFPGFATVEGDTVPAGFFLDSERCRDCHAQIYEDWSQSAHRFASFNNQWYLASIVYLQDRAGTRRSRWCASCHDPALLFTGAMDIPAADLLERPEAHAGIPCVVCHAITHVGGTTGQGDYTLGFTSLHALSLDAGPALRELQEAVLRINPEIHRRTFIKPFMREQPAEFCSVCHKVHLDVPLNDYRWVRGFDEYDAWQRSGVSGQGVAAFYFPPTPRTCVDCHMPVVRAEKEDHAGPMLHSHRFPAANDALPLVNGFGRQIEAIADFLAEDRLRVDVFAATLPGAGPAAPLDRSLVTVAPGETVRIDVVVRNAGLGHAFPGGTADGADAWLEVTARDAAGALVFASGQEDEAGARDPDAHVYRILMVDRDGAPIDKRNAWEARAVVYRRTIGPGAAEVARYRVTIPDRASEGPIMVTARLRYRKFQPALTAFAWGGTVPLSPAVAASFGAEAPRLPAKVLAEDSVTLRIASHAAAQAAPDRAQDWERWNDYGIGLLLQRDLSAALPAFERVAAIAPERPDGWSNAGRTLLAMGANEAALARFDRALALAPDHPAAAYFRGLTLRALGRLDEAAIALADLAGRFPRDRGLQRDLGRLSFLRERYRDAVTRYEAVLAIDPEDADAHYNLALSFRALGDADRAAAHERRFQRFKEDESADERAADYRRRDAAANREAQAVHEHGSSLAAPGR